MAPPEVMLVVMSRRIGQSRPVGTARARGFVGRRLSAPPNGAVEWSLPCPLQNSIPTRSPEAAICAAKRPRRATWLQRLTVTAATAPPRAFATASCAALWAVTAPKFQLPLTWAIRGASDRISKGAPGITLPLRTLSTYCG